MPQRAKTICRQTGCGQPTVGPYCSKHITENSKLDYRRFVNKNDSIGALYRLRGAWPKLRNFLRVRNPVCQRLHNGVQCPNPSVIGHHLISPRISPDPWHTLLDPKNVVMLCAGCHPGGEAGTPHWREGIDFVPTVSTLSL
jgi:hypothetical protein